MDSPGSVRAMASTVVNIDTVRPWVRTAVSPARGDGRGPIHLTFEIRDDDAQPRAIVAGRRSRTIGVSNDPARGASFDGSREQPDASRSPSTTAMTARRGDASLTNPIARTPPRPSSARGNPSQAPATWRAEPSRAGTRSARTAGTTLPSAIDRAPRSGSSSNVPVTPGGGPLGPRARTSGRLMGASTINASASPVRRRCRSSSCGMSIAGLAEPGKLDDHRACSTTSDRRQHRRPAHPLTHRHGPSAHDPGPAGARARARQLGRAPRDGR